VERALRAVAWLAAALYVAVGVGELVFAGESFGHRAIFTAVMCIFAALVLVGVRLIDARPWVGAALASLGAIGAGISIFWTVVAVFLATAIVVLSILVARRGGKAVFASS